MKKALVWLSVLVLATSTIFFCFGKTAQAVAVLVQKTNNVTNGGTSVTATFGAGAIANHLLVAVCGARDLATITGPSGFSTAINESGSPSQGIFYKVAAGGETALSCSTGLTSTRLGMHIYEYRGVVASSPLDAVNTLTSVGVSAAPASGSVTTANANDLIIAGVTTNANTVFSAWSNSFTEQSDFANGGAAGSRSTYGGSDRTVSSTGTYSTVATAGASGAWRGQIASFKLIDPVLAADIVDSGGSSVASPSIAMGSTSFKFDCQTANGTLGTSSERIRISNFTSNPAWTLSIAATSGATGKWTTGSLDYDFNDSAGTPAGCGDGADSDSLAGQMSINPSAATLTAQSGCTTTGLTRGSNAAFAEGVTNSITLSSASASALVGCYWDLTNISVSQNIPREQAEGSYSISMTLTITAN